MNFASFLKLVREPSFKSHLRLAWEIAKAVVVAVPTTVEVFLHRGFGTRTAGSFAKGLVILIAVFLIPPSKSPAIIPLFPGFVFAYVIVAIGQWLTSRFGMPVGEIHSHSMGRPWPIWERVPVATSTVHRYFEPALCWLFAFVLSALDPSLSTWLVIAGGALFIKGQLRRIETRSRQLDTLDDRTEAHETTPRARPENETFVEARPAPPRGQHRHPHP